MKKSIWVVTVDNYQPELCKITLPNLEAYAKRIGAEFNVIKNRKWPSVSPTYEKLQVHELGKDSDWNIILDADMVIDDQMNDPTTVIPPTMIASWMCYEASVQFPSDKYFCRNGRNLGVSTNFIVVPHVCHDALTPFEESDLESRTKIRRPFILDEYCVSRNVAKYGLKYCGILSDLENPPFRHLNYTSGKSSCINGKSF